MEHYTNSAAHYAVFFSLLLIQNFRIRFVFRGSQSLNIGPVVGLCALFL